MEPDAEDRVPADEADPAHLDVCAGRVGVDVARGERHEDLAADLAEQRERVVPEVELGAEPAPPRGLGERDGEPALRRIVDQGRVLPSSWRRPR